MSLDKEICIFCFDEFTTETPKVTENIIGCPCKYMIHEDCWARWNIYECPICHKLIEEEYESETEDQEDGAIIPPVQIVIHRPNVNQPSILYNLSFILFIYMIIYTFVKLIL